MEVKVLQFDSQQGFPSHWVLGHFLRSCGPLLVCGAEVKNVWSYTWNS